MRIVTVNVNNSQNSNEYNNNNNEKELRNYVLKKIFFLQSVNTLFLLNYLFIYFKINLLPTMRLIYERN